jgi:hypothetical protein
MKKIINTMYNSLIAWAETIVEYRQSQSRKYY